MTVVMRCRPKIPIAPDITVWIVQKIKERITQTQTAANEQVRIEMGDRPSGEPKMDFVTFIVEYNTEVKCKNTGPPLFINLPYYSLMKIRILARRRWSAFPMADKEYVYENKEPRNANLYDIILKKILQKKTFVWTFFVSWKNRICTMKTLPFLTIFTMSVTGCISFYSAKSSIQIDRTFPIPVECRISEFNRCKGSVLLRPFDWQLENYTDMLFDLDDYFVAEFLVNIINNSQDNAYIYSESWGGGDLISLEYFFDGGPTNIAKRIESNAPSVKRIADVIPPNGILSYVVSWDSRDWDNVPTALPLVGNQKSVKYNVRAIISAIDVFYNGEYKTISLESSWTEISAGQPRRVNLTLPPPKKLQIVKKKMIFR